MIELPETIFDKDEDVISFKFKFMYVTPPGPSPRRVLLIRSKQDHACYRLIYGDYLDIHSIYTAIKEKRIIKEDGQVMVLNAYIYTDPNIKDWKSRQCMQDIVSFGYDDSEGEAWDEICMERYVEGTPVDILEFYEGCRPSGFDRYYVDLNNYVFSTIALMTNCFGASSTCEVPTHETQEYLCDKIFNQMSEHYNDVLNRKMLDSCFNPRVFYE